MSNDTVVSLAAPALVPDPLTELLRSGARRLVEAAVRAEFEEHLSAFGHEKLPDGRQRVVRNGRLPERKILTGLGEVEVRVPKARSRSGSPEPFRSSVAPPYVRRCASLDAAIPWLYLHGVSTGQMRQAVGALVGERAARGLSANVVSRLKRSWDQEYRQWRRRRLDDEWVYLWADGLYSGLRGEGERLCVLVVIGVNTRDEKHFLAIEDGMRESTQSWREVLLAMKQRGFTRPAKLAVGDGAMGFWAALSEVFPSTRPQRCWVHKTGNVLNYLPKSGQAKAKPPDRAARCRCNRTRAHRSAWPERPPWPRRPDWCVRPRRGSPPPPPSRRAARPRAHRRRRPATPSGPRGGDLLQYGRVPRQGVGWQPNRLRDPALQPGTSPHHGRGQPEWQGEQAERRDREQPGDPLDQQIPADQRAVDIDDQRRMIVSAEEALRDAHAA